MNAGQKLICEFIEAHTRPVSKAWIGNRALYESFLRWAESKGWEPGQIAAIVSFLSFGRSLGHILGIPTVRKWMRGRQVYGRKLWPCGGIQENLKFGVDFL